MKYHGNVAILAANIQLSYVFTHFRQFASCSFLVFNDITLLVLVKSSFCAYNFMFNQMSMHFEIACDNLINSREHRMPAAPFNVTVIEFPYRFHILNDLANGCVYVNFNMRGSGKLPLDVSQYDSQKSIERRFYSTKIFQTISSKVS